MSPELQEALVGFLVSVTNKIEGTTDIFNQQLPDVIMQLITWTIIWDIITIVITSVLIAVFFVFLIKTYKAPKNSFYKDSYGDTTVIVTISLIALGCITIIAFMLNISAIRELVQMYIAPKVFLLEYLLHFKGK